MAYNCLAPMGKYDMYLICMASCVPQSLVPWQPWHPPSPTPPTPFRTSPALLKAFSEMNSLINGEAKAFTCRFEDSRILWTQVETETALSADFPVDSLKNIPKKHESYPNWWIWPWEHQRLQLYCIHHYTSNIPDWSFFWPLAPSKDQAIGEAPAIGKTVRA